MKFLLLLVVYFAVFNINVDGGVLGLTKYFRSYTQSWTAAQQQSLSSSIKKRRNINKNDNGSKGTVISNGKVMAVDHVCIDMNHIVHSSFRSTSTVKHCISRIFSLVDNLFKYVQPTASLVFAFDGPAPFAKLQTQRSKRKSSPESALITPGTDFMKSMDDVIMTYVLQRISRFSNVTIFVSGSNIPGEGELKIVDWVRTQMPSNNGTVVICGADSDILIQAIPLTDISQIQVLQTSGDYPDSFCNISSIINEFSKKSNRNENPELSESFKMDLLVLFALHGNDYLPKLRGISLTATLRAYGNAIERLPVNQRFLIDVRHKTFNFAALWLLMENLKLQNQTIQKLWTMPTALGELSNYFAKNKINGTYIDEMLTTPQNKISWTSSILIEGQNFTSCEYSSKRECRQAVSETALKSLSPETYEDLLNKQKQFRRTMREKRIAVMEEHQKRIEYSNTDLASNHRFIGVVKDVSEDDDYETEYDDDMMDTCDEDKYILQSDVEQYLQGILWVAQMYMNGKCPDVSYTYIGKPSMSPFMICKYLEMSSDKNVTSFVQSMLLSKDISSCIISDFNTKLLKSLKDKVFVPTSDMKPLSAIATCISVIPTEAKEFVPQDLKHTWHTMQTNFFDSDLQDISYEKLLKGLEHLWLMKSNSSVNVDYLVTNSSTKAGVSRMSRSNRKSQYGKTKQAVKLMHEIELIASSSNKINVNTTNNAGGSVRGAAKGSFTFDTMNSWTVITTVQDLNSVGYLSTFKVKYVKFPLLRMPFKTPKELPKYVRVLTAIGKERGLKIE